MMEDILAILGIATAIGVFSYSVALLYAGTTFNLKPAIRYGTCSRIRRAKMARYTHSRAKDFAGLKITESARFTVRLQSYFKYDQLDQMLDAGILAPPPILERKCK